MRAIVLLLSLTYIFEIIFKMLYKSPSKWNLYYKYSEAISDDLSIFKVSFGVLGPTRKFSTHLETSLWPAKAKIFTCARTHDQRFSNVPHLLWLTLYYCHFRGPPTLTMVAEHLALELSLPLICMMQIIFSSNITPKT